MAPGAVPPFGPLHSFYAPVPYVNKRGTARLDDWVPGDEVVGLKLRLRENERWAPALAIGAELKLPLTRDLIKLQSGRAREGWTRPRVPSANGAGAGTRWSSPRPT